MQSRWTEGCRWIYSSVLVALLFEGGLPVSEYDVGIAIKHSSQAETKVLGLRIGAQCLLRDCDCEVEDLRRKTTPGGRHTTEGRAPR